MYEIEASEQNKLAKTMQCMCVRECACVNVCASGQHATATATAMAAAAVVVFVVSVAAAKISFESDEKLAKQFAVAVDVVVVD